MNAKSLGTSLVLALVVACGSDAGSGDGGDDGSAPDAGGSAGDGTSPDDDGADGDADGSDENLDGTAGDGSDATDGVDGVDGVDGMDGVDGADGSDGGNVSTEGCPPGAVGVDVAATDFGLTSTTTWTPLGTAQSQLPSGANAKWGLVTVTRCGILVLADNNQKYDAYLSTGGQGFTKISTTSSDTMYGGREGVRGPLEVVGDTVAWKGGTSSNTWHVWTMPLAGGEIGKVSSPDDTGLQIYGFVPGAETSYFISSYGTGVLSGLRSVATGKLLDSSLVVDDTTQLRTTASNASSYLHPFGAGKVLFNGTIVDATCTSECIDTALPTGNVIQGEPYRTEDGVVVQSTYDKEIAAIAPGDEAWLESAAITDLRVLNEVAMAGGKGIASYDVNGVDGDKIVFFSKGIDSVSVEAAPVGVTGKYSGVWTNGVVALVYATSLNSGQGTVYGIKLP